MAVQDRYIPRLITSAIQEALSDTPVVCLLGPRQSGKTTLVQHQFPDRPYTSLDSKNSYFLASTDPEGFIKRYPSQVTIDEVQRVPELLTAIKLSVDQNRKPGRFLLTGSANLLLLPYVTESLAGRMEIIQLHPLSEAEKSQAPGQFVYDLINRKLKSPIECDKQPSADLAVVKRLLTGGYPEVLTRSLKRVRQWHKHYINNIIERDVHSVTTQRNTYQLRRLLELCALRSGSLLNINALANSLGIHRNTVEQNISLLERLFLIRRFPAWHSNKAKRLIKSPKLHIVDSGLAGMLSELALDDWYENREFMGHILESFVVQQIVAQAGWTEPDLRFWHYRDKNQMEVDIVVTHGRKTWGIEVKASTTLGKRDSSGLVRLADQCGKDFQQGIVLYNGSSIVPLGDKRILAVPLSELWMR